MDNLYQLAQISLASAACKDIDSYPYRDQAFYLSQLLQSGYPVTNGFIIPGDVFWQYLKVLGESETLLADLYDSDLHLDIHQPQQLRNIAQKLRQMVLQGNPPAIWLETLTNHLTQITTPLVELQPFLQHEGFPAPNAMLETVVCANQSEAVLAGLQQVWGQLFQARNLFCWQPAGMKLSQVNLAVLVQPLEDAIASGVITASPEQLEIESTWGLPLTIHRGEVLPDHYLINPQTGVLLKQRLGSKTRAYHLNPSSPSLLTCLLTPEEQQSYSLSISDLAIVTQVCQQLQEMVSPNFTFAWRIINPRNDLTLNLTNSSVDNSPSRLLITAFTPRARQRYGAISPQVSVHNTLLSLKGLAVARGEVTAMAHVLIAAGFSRLSTQNNPNAVPGMETSLLGKILVAEVVLPEWLPLLRQAAGIITEQGGMTSHGAIIARELGIPAIVGVTAATRLIQTGESLTLDGNQGIIYRQHPPGSLENSFTSVLSPNLLAQTPLVSISEDSGELNRGASLLSSDVKGSSLVEKLHQKLAHSRAVNGEVSNNLTGDLNGNLVNNLPRVTELLVNLSQPRGIAAAINLPVDGVGLLRSEFILTEILQHHNLSTFQDITFLSVAPEQTFGQINEQGASQVVEEIALQKRVITALADVITEFVAAFAPRPVFYRSADWRSAEFPSLFSREIPETNPVLGRRGTFLYTKDPQLFDWELAALRELQQRGYGNIRLLLPFVRTVEEFSFCRQRVEQSGLFLQPQFELWIMAEVPSVLFLLPDYVRAGVQGISIGSNDLTQLILGCDRDQGDMAATLNESHPAVVAAIGQLITTARQLQIPCSICGQAPVNYPQLIEKLVAWGITSISVDAPAVETTHQAIVKAEYKLLLELARNSP